MNKRAQKKLIDLAEAHAEAVRRHHESCIRAMEWALFTDAHCVERDGCIVVYPETASRPLNGRLGIGDVDSRYTVTTKDGSN